MSSSVVFDLYRHDSSDGVTTSKDIGPVVIELWQAREPLAALSLWRDRAPVTSHRYIDQLRDAISEAL